MVTVIKLAAFVWAVLFLAPLAAYTLVWLTIRTLALGEAVGRSWRKILATVATLAAVAALGALGAAGHSAVIGWACLGLLLAVVTREAVKGNGARVRRVLAMFLERYSAPLLIGGAAFALSVHLVPTGELLSTWMAAGAFVAVMLVIHRLGNWLIGWYHAR